MLHTKGGPNSVTDMKAKDYFERFDAFPRVPETVEEDPMGFNELSIKVIKDMVGEIATIGTERGVQKKSAFVSIVREQNQKFKALNRMLVKKYGQELYVEEPILKFIKAEMPDIWTHIQGEV